MLSKVKKKKRNVEKGIKFEKLLRVVRFVIAKWCEGQVFKECIILPGIEIVE